MENLFANFDSSQINEDRTIQTHLVKKSISDPISRVEMALKNSSEDMKLIAIKSCKYLLPCGKCDKTDKMCSQWQFMPLKQ